MYVKKICFSALVAMSFISCETKSDQKTVDTKKDVLFENLDSTVSPGQDFFMYANGQWVKNNPIPGDQGSWGIAHLVIEENLKRLREISEKSFHLSG